MLSPVRRRLITCTCCVRRRVETRITLQTSRFSRELYVYVLGTISAITNRVLRYGPGRLGRGGITVLNFTVWHSASRNLAGPPLD